MANLFGNNQPAVSPFQAQKPVNPLQSQKPNFQTISGQNTYVPPPSTGVMQQMAMGAKASAPEQKVSAPKTVLPSNQQTTYTAPPQKQNNSIVGNTVIPQDPNGTYAPTSAPAAPTNGSVPSPYQAPQNSGLYGQMLAALGNRSQHDSPEVTAAREALLKSQQSQAGGLKTIYSNPIPIGDQEGQAAVLRNQYLQNNTALSNVLTSATQTQGQQIGALGSAVGAAQPQLGQFGQGYYNPLDPNGGAASAGGGALNPLNNVSSIAQQVVSGQISPQQAYSMGGTIANWQSFLNNAIQQSHPGFNTASAQGQFDARQQNTTTAGTASTNAYANAYGQNYPAALQLQGQLQNVEGLGGLLLSTAQGGQINPFAPQLANNTVAQFRSQLSSPDQAKFNSTLAAFQGAASQLLSTGSGQIPTDVSANIAAISNGSLSLGALKAMVDQAKQEGGIKLQTAQQLVNTPGSQIGAPQVGGNNNPLGI